MSSLPSDITVPGRPEVHQVSAGVYASIQPNGSIRDRAGQFTGSFDAVFTATRGTHQRVLHRRVTAHRTPRILFPSPTGSSLVPVDDGVSAPVRHYVL
jgi:hypothetical protein